MNLFRCFGELKISGFITIRKEIIVKTLNLPGDIHYNGSEEDIKTFFKSIYKLDRGNWIVEVDEPFFNAHAKRHYLRRKYRIIVSVTKSKVTVNSYPKILDRYCNKAKRTPKHTLLIEETDNKWKLKEQD